MRANALSQQGLTLPKEISRNKRVKLNLTGLEIKIFSREPNCIFISFIKVFCMSNTYLGSLQIFEGAAGAFKGAEAPGAP